MHQPPAAIRRGEVVGERRAFDHAELLRAALVRLRSNVEFTSLPRFLLPAEFTLTQLQRKYEVILGCEPEKKALRTRTSSHGRSGRRREGTDAESVRPG